MNRKEYLENAKEKLKEEMAAVGYDDRKFRRLARLHQRVEEQLGELEGTTLRIQR